MLWEVCLLRALVALLLAGSVRLHCDIHFHQLTFAVAHSQMPVLNLDVDCSCVLLASDEIPPWHNIIPIRKNLIPGTKYFFFFLIMHHINIKCLPKEKTINICFHFNWRYDRLW